MENLFASAAAPFTAFVAAHAAWAGPIVFAICFAESLVIVSAIVPATMLLIAIGSLATAGALDLATLSLWGIVGSGLGFWISYELGRRYSEAIHRWKWLAKRPELVARGHQFFERWGIAAVFIGRFVGIGRVVVPLLAGSTGMRPRIFHLANWISAILWAPLMLAPTAIGAWLAAQMEELPPPIRSSIVIAIVGVGLIAWRAWRTNASRN